jgi:Ion channel
MNEALQTQKQDSGWSGLGARPLAEWLQTGFGIPADQVQSYIARAGQWRKRLEKSCLDWSYRNPLDAAFQFLVLSSLAFYQAEKEVNPKINTFIDAFYYIATCASVGYADIFAATQAGRAIAGLVMIVGPALTNKALDRPQERKS